jgi:hypothetical protein
LHGLLRRLVGVRDDLDIITCEDAAAWDGWLAANYRLHQGVWVKITKQHTGVASVTNDGAVDVASAGAGSRATARRSTRPISCSGTHLADRGAIGRR